MSLNTGQVPEALKTGSKTLIVKKGDATNVNDVMHITPTPIVGKLLERYVADYITDYLEKKKIIVRGTRKVKKQIIQLQDLLTRLSPMHVTPKTKENTKWHLF